MQEGSHKMAVSRDLAARKTVVTGGAMGIGRAIAHRFAASGASVTIVDLEATRDKSPREFGFFGCDLGTPDSKARLMTLAEDLGLVDILVANAGVVPPWGGIRELDGEEWRRVMAINTWGLAASIGAFADALSRSKSASIIVMASINGYRAHAKQVLYSASKHAAIGIMRAAALDLGPSGIRVNALAPGPIATDALMERISARYEAGGPSTDEVLKLMENETALKRMATVEEVANAALFLASDASSGMSGSVLPVESGLN